uniref:WRKY domain-containing protein n=1 Tax=Leersia perrieri TaxID=77586 RepID=A0A0D9VZ98_9ORYZ
MADRRGGGGDGMRQPPSFSSAAQERVFDGGGGVPGQVASYGSDFDQSSYMALLAAAAGAGAGGPQPPAWDVDEDVAAASPGISLTPQFSMANYATPSYQHQLPLAGAGAGNLQPYPLQYLQALDAPPQWPPPRPTPSSSSTLHPPPPPPNFTVFAAPPHEHHHHHHHQSMQHLLFRGGVQAQAAAAVTIEQPAKDGYNWRKYGQKQLKDAESPRSYYKCTRDGCPVKKIVERSSDGCIKEITYKGRHTHPRLGGGDNAGADIAGGEVDEEEPSDDEMLHEDDGDGEEGHDRGAEGETGQRVVRKPKIILQTPSEVDLLDDGFRWRKYGQKVVKGNPRPRSYYKCTADGCNVRKQIERASADPKCVLTTYTGRHNHDPPGRTAGAGSSGNVQMPGPAMNLDGGGGTAQQLGGGVRQMKEET